MYGKSVGEGEVEGEVEVDPHTGDARMGIIPGGDASKIKVDKRKKKKKSKNGEILRFKF